VALFRDSDLIPFLDFAYQGFGKGLDQDAYAVRAFAAAEIPCLISNSFSKSFSLYRERVGALTLITESADESRRILSQVKRVIRTNYSNPPSHGGQVVALILGDAELRFAWEQELADMRARIARMRTLFVQMLRAKGVQRDFSFIERQNGMFSFAGLSLDAVRRLRSEYSLYIVDSSRICVAAMNERNMDYICDAIATVA
jgi:aromatic-amino-acid transaminase